MIACNQFGLFCIAASLGEKKELRTVNLKDLRESYDLAEEQEEYKTKLNTEYYATLRRRADNDTYDFMKFSRDVHFLKQVRVLDEKTLIKDIVF